jgi:hypothetical protein
MARRVGTALLLVLCLAGPVLAVADFLITGIPSPTDVIKVIDALTKKESSTTVDIQRGNTVSQGKLLIARTRVDVVLERSSRNWRGRVLVHMVVPSDVSYSLDLSEIRPEHIRCDPKERLVVVAMPQPHVEDVTPLLASLRTDNTYKRARFRFFDKAVARDLQNTILKEDYQARARKAADSYLPGIRAQGRAALQQLLQKLLGQASPGVRVVVE